MDWTLVPAIKIIGALRNRKGFDEWYHDLDIDIKNEILTEITKIIKEND